MQKRNTLHLDEKQVKTHISVMQNSKHSAYYAKKGTHTALMIKKRKTHSSYDEKKRNTHSSYDEKKENTQRLYCKKEHAQSIICKK